MKKITMIAALLGSAYFANAQVGIGTPTPATSAMLDITATNKGVLIPRVALTANDDQTTVTTPTTSLLVYNTNTSDANVADVKKVTPGFYYWNVNKWERIVSQTDLTNAIEEANAELNDIISLLQTAYPSNNLDGSTTTGSALGGGMVYTPASGTTPAKIEYVYYNGTSYVKQDLSGMLADIIDPANGSVFYNNIGTETAPEFAFQYWDASLNNGEGGFTTITISDLVQANETKTKIQTIEGKQFYFAENFEGVIPTNIPASLPAGMYLIDVVGGVVNNIEEIFTTTTNIVINEGETNEQTFTTVQEYIEYISQNADLKDGVMTFVPGTGTTLAQQLASSSFTYNVTDTNGNTTTVTVNFSDLVKANETKTKIQTIEGKQFYFAENFEGVIPTSIPASLPAGMYLIDVVGGVVNNIEEIFTTTTNIVINEGETNEQTFTTVQEYIEYISQNADLKDGVMTFVPGTGTTLPEQLASSSFTYNVTNTNGDTTTVTVNFSDLVKANETKTTIARSENGGDYAQVTTDSKATDKVVYEYSAEGGVKNYLDITEDIRWSIENNSDIQEIINEIANGVDAVYYSTSGVPAGTNNGVQDGAALPANSFYYLNSAGDKVAVPLPSGVTPETIIAALDTATTTQIETIKTQLGDKIIANTSVITGDTYKGKVVRKGIFSTTIAANTATTSGVTLDVAADQIISITVKYNGGLVANVTDLAVSDTVVTFNIGTGNMYQVLGNADITAEVIVEFAVQ